MRVVVTGASGRIGRAIHARLSPRHDVVGVDRVPSPAADVVGDVGDAALLRRVLAGADAVVHAAALHAPHVGHVPDDEFERVNVAATREIVDAAARSRIRRIVFTSTTALYGAGADPGDRARWVDETTPPRPLTIYHRTKLAAEALLAEAAASGGPSVRTLRMSRCFPEPAPLMAVYRLHRGVDARDVAAAHALALEHEGAAYATWVVSGETPFVPEDAAALMADAASVVRRRAPALAAAFARRGWPLPRSIDRVYDPGPAARELGWRSRHGFAEVLRQLDEGSPEVLAPPG